MKSLLSRIRLWFERLEERAVGQGFIDTYNEKVDQWNSEFKRYGLSFVPYVHAGEGLTLSAAMRENDKRFVANRMARRMISPHRRVV